MSTDFRGDPVRGAARGAGPGAEPHLQRSLPRPRLRPLEGACSSAPRTPCSGIPRAAAGPHGDHPHRRLHRPARSSPSRSATWCPSSARRTGSTSIDRRCSPTRRLMQLIHHYTKEAGVRESRARDRDAFCRKVAKRRPQARQPGREDRRHREEACTSCSGRRASATARPRSSDQIGLVTGLAWTEVGGELLQTEVTVLPGKGKLIITGKLGDVMQESAQAAMSYVRSRAERFGLDKTSPRTSTCTSTCPRARSPRTALRPASPWPRRWCRALTRIAGAQGRRHDRRDHAARARAAHRRAQGEGAGGAPRRDRRSSSSPRRTRRTCARSRSRSGAS